jgi:phosphate transport system permease protein
MSLLALIVALVGLCVAFYVDGRRRAWAVAGGRAARLKSLPSYHGAFLAMVAVVPGLIVLIATAAMETWTVDRFLEPVIPQSVRELDPGGRALWLMEVKRTTIQADGPAVESGREDLRPYAARVRRIQRSLTAGAVTSIVALGALCGMIARRRITVAFPARYYVERATRGVMAVAAVVAVMTTLGIVLSLVAESYLFFQRVPAHEFLLGLQWSPQTALRSDQVGASGAFGAVPLFAGTLLVTAIAMSVAVPLGLLSAVFTSEYASAGARAAVKPLLEILAGIPTVVYGFFAALTVAPALRSAGEALGLDVASESALAAGSVMGIMIIPFISSLSDDVMNAVPQSLRDGAYALGATKSETIRQIVLPAALPGIASAVLLAISRAIGETMIVVMAAGLAGNLTFNPLSSVTTVTVQIVTLLVGDQEFDSAKTLAAFALGLVLFVVTLCLNVGALIIVRRYREQYE